MIELHIVTKKTKQAKEIIELLITGELITGVTMIETKSSYKDDKCKIVTVPSNLIIGRTKARRFNAIEKLLIHKYGDNVPAIYGMPIVGMDDMHMKKYNN